MLDNPYYLFTPLLNQFNVLYQFIKDKKRKAKLTMEETAEELLVNPLLKKIQCVHVLYISSKYSIILIMHVPVYYIYMYICIYCMYITVHVHVESSCCVFHACTCMYCICVFY